MKALVTGGGGFLGRRITELLLERGDEVTILARGRYPAIEALGARGVQADLRNKDALRAAVRGQDVVFHVAALATSWAKPEDFYAVNVLGTRNLIDVMEDTGTPRLVFTSTPSVTASGEPVRGGGMDLPHAEQNDSPYGATKAEAERMVCDANSRHLATVALRPRLIFGPREENLLPLIMKRALDRKLPKVGDGTNKVDMTYIDNAAWAHLDAEAALQDHTSACAGKAYFISNGEPVVLWDWIRDFFDANEIPQPHRELSLNTARRAAAVMEWAWRNLPLKGEPRITKQAVTALGTDQYYDMEPAYRDLGYRVRVPMTDGTAATVQWFTQGKASLLIDGKEVVYAPDPA